jgi:quinoprotein glucose dehydrogenase
MRRAVQSCSVVMIALVAGAAADDGGDWAHYGRDAYGTRYSPLDQITKDNVAELEVAWTYRTGDLALSKTKKGRYVFECTPLVIDGVMYLITPFSRAIAIDATTGEELWLFDPAPGDPGEGGVLAARGVAAYRRDGHRTLFVPQREGRLHALDLDTGRPMERFGDGGSVNMRKLIGPGGDRAFLSSPPAIIGDVVIQGFGLPDGPADLDTTWLVGLDAVTGAVRWNFNTVPQAGEFGADTWKGGANRNRGGVNVWSMMSVDSELGLVYLPATSPTFDFYGGDRPGANLYGNSVIALDGRTGERRWHFQTVHHDLWDYDLPAQPVLTDIVVDGKPIKALAQIGKTGFVYVLNRETGEPVWPIEERPVPTDGVDGEPVYPTQPFPTKPPAFSKQGLTADELSNIDPETNGYLRTQFAKYRSGGIFTPPTEQGTIVMPGFHGGGNWSGGCYNPETGLFYVNSTELACMVEIRPQQNRYGHGVTGWLRFRDPDGYPGNAPPWGLLNAIDLNRGEIVWQVPLGEFEALSARGVPVTGQENFGGPSVTAGGLVFIASTLDAHLRAFDAATGDVLWKTKLPTGGHAIPVTYIGTDSRQYVAICSGGHTNLGTEAGDTFLAFAVPADNKPG